jgi:hypothetical protein
MKFSGVGAASFLIPMIQMVTLPCAVAGGRFEVMPNISHGHCYPKNQCVIRKNCRLHIINSLVIKQKTGVCSINASPSIPNDAARNAILEMIKNVYSDSFLMKVVAERLEKCQPHAGEDSFVECSGNVRWHPTRLIFVITFYNQFGPTKICAGEFVRTKTGRWEARITQTIDSV